MKNNIKEYINHGLDLIDEKEFINIEARKALLIYKTIEELISFFHQRKHYQTIEDVEAFIGDKNHGMFAVLMQIYNRDFEDILPTHLKEISLDDKFYSSEKQYYKYPKKLGLE